MLERIEHNFLRGMPKDLILSGRTYEFVCVGCPESAYIHIPPAKSKRLLEDILKCMVAKYSEGKDFPSEQMMLDSSNVI